jgi:polo-like kinase 1
LIKERGKLTEKEVACYMLQLIIALNFLHSNKIIHRDLKPANLLLGQNMELKIGDFGLATKILEGKIKGIAGTISYCAPEVLKNEDYSFEADIWSLGIIMYNLLTHEYPFYAETEKEIANKIKENRPDLSGKISKAASDLIKQILEKDPSKRPTLNQIIYHDFFSRGGIPKYLPDSTKKEAPLDYPQDILNKEEIIYNDLKRIVRNIIKPITYDSIHNIDEIRINNFNYIKIDIYIKNYLDIIKRFGVGYELNNGNIGVYYKDKTKILLDPDTNEFSFYDKKNEVFHYKMWDYPDNLENKIKILISFIKYFEKFKKDNYKTIYEPKNKDDKERDNNIYVNDAFSIDECIKFKLSNETNHIFFHDKVQIIISYAEQRVIYIDKDKNITNLLLGEASINPCRELRKRIKFIQKLNVESIVTKMKHKIEKVSY